MQNKTQHITRSNFILPTSTSRSQCFSFNNFTVQLAKSEDILGFKCLYSILEHNDTMLIR